MGETTLEQQLAVRRDECRARGHSFSTITQFGSLAPQQFVCMNCGASWRVHPDDIDKDFGQIR